MSKSKPWNGITTTLELSDEEQYIANKMAYGIGRIVREIDESNEVKRSRARILREKARRKVVPCSKCGIRATCEKRRKKHLKGCKFPFPCGVSLA